MPVDVGADQSVIVQVMDIRDRGVEPEFKIREVFVPGR
jgi:hypothetical protein